MRRLAPVIMLAAAWPSAAAGGDRPTEVTTEMELLIESVHRLGAYEETVIFAAADPNFVLSGTITWIKRPALLPVDSQQSFAIHSRAQFLLAEWTPGDKRCFKLTRWRRAGRTSWSLFPALGQRACKH